MADSEQRLGIDDFTAAGGEWYGMLLDNPSLRLPPQLTWCFEVAFEELPDEDGPLGLTVEWVPLAAPSWRQMAGQRVTSASFGEPAEASVYRDLHHRFDRVALDLTQQRGRELRATITVSGDVDGLGVDPVRADSWLTFTGLFVSLHGVTDPDLALARLGEFTDPTGLVFDPAGTTSALHFTDGAD